MPSTLSYKAKIVKKMMSGPIDKLILVAVNIDKEAYKRAKELGIDVIYGHVLD